MATQYIFKGHRIVFVEKNRKKDSDVCLIIGTYEYITPSFERCMVLFLLYNYREIEIERLQSGNNLFSLYHDYTIELVFGIYWY